MAPSIAERGQQARVFGSRPESRAAGGCATLQVAGPLWLNGCTG